MIRLRTTLLPLITATVPSLAAQEPPAFVADVLPILQERCFRCHQAEHRDERGKIQKPKGGLRLDGRRLILRGGDGGEVLTPGEPDDSELYLLTTLPPDDPDVMPAKGDPLTAAEQDLLRRWIVAGASFGEWRGAESSDVPAPAAAEAVLEPAQVRLWRRLGEDLRPAPASQIASAAATDARIAPVIPGGPLLAVAFTTDLARVDDARVARLAALREHVVELDLGGTTITDGVLREVGRMRRLVRLDLHGTAVTDRGLARLLELAELRSLNLYDTDVTDAGIADLGDLPNLERVYVWQSGVTEEGVARLRAARPGMRVIAAPELPVVKPRRDDQTDRGRRRRP